MWSVARNPPKANFLTDYRGHASVRFPGVLQLQCVTNVGNIKFGYRKFEKFRHGLLVEAVESEMLSFM